MNWAAERLVAQTIVDRLGGRYWTALVGPVAGAESCGHACRVYPCGSICRVRQRGAVFVASFDGRAWAEEGPSPSHAFEAACASLGGDAQ